MAKFICTVCGYIHEGDAAPEKCPLCKAPASKFNEMVETEGVFDIRLLQWLLWWLRYSCRTEVWSKGLWYDAAFCGS